MRSWLLPPRRVVEADPQQIIATGAAGGGWAVDPVDGDRGWALAGSRGREVPKYTQEKARTLSINAYRANPMAKAIIDTYTSFCVGDSGVSFQASNAQVHAVVDQWWNDPRNRIGAGQELGLRSNLLMGETVRELMIGKGSGVVRYSPIDPQAINEVQLLNGNPMWPYKVLFGPGDEERGLLVAAVNDETGLREGECLFWAPFRTTENDVRSMPFLASVLDDLDAYATVLSNLIDRTALARYMVWDVTVEGDQTAVDAFVTQRGGTHVPPSGSVEVHNGSVKWEAKNVQTGAYEDSAAARSVLTNVAAGPGLAKTWLAEPEDANRATSLSMAEPVRRRVQGVQKVWLDYQTEWSRLVVDRAVAAHRLPRTVKATNEKTGQTYDIPAAQSVTVTGPEVAAADAQITAQVLLNLSTGLEKLVAIGALSKEAAAVAARKGWEDYVGLPFVAELAKPDAERDKVADHVDSSDNGKNKLRAV
jgi:hypothetical protein